MITQRTGLYSLHLSLLYLLILDVCLTVILYEIQAKDRFTEMQSVTCPS